MTDRELGVKIRADVDGRREIEQLNDSYAEFRQQLKDSERDFENSRRATIALKSEYNQLRDSGEASREELQNQSRKIDESQKSQLKLIESTRELIRAFKEAQPETDEFSDRFVELTKRLQEAEGWINGITPKVKAMGDGFHRVDNNLKDLNATSKQTNQTLDRVDDTMQDIAKSSQDLSSKLGPSMVAMGNLVSDGMQAAAEAVFDFSKESVESFHNFDRQSREIFTLIPDASAEMKQQLQADALDLGTELGRLPEETLPAIYNALSAGIPADNVIDSVRTASEAARAGVADLDSTLKLGVGILNAQVDGVNNLEEVYDLLFFTVKNGVITLPEMNEVMSQVTSVAGEAGVSMQDISAAMITMTRQGDSAAEAAELLSIMLTQLSTSGTTMATTFEEAAGKSFRQFIAEGGNLADAMGILQDHADNTGQALGDILGGGSPFFRDTQAARGALELTGKHLEELQHFAAEAEGAMGSMGEAAATMGESAELGTLQAKAAVEEFKIAFGELIDPIVTAGATVAKETAQMGADVLSLAEKIDQAGDEVIETAAATGDYAAAGEKLATALDDSYSVLGVLSGGYKTVREDAVRLIATTGDFTGTAEDLEASLKAVYGETARVSGGAIYLGDSLVGTVEEATKLNETLGEEANLLAATSEAIDQYDQKLIQNSNTRAQIQEQFIEEKTQRIEFKDALDATTAAYLAETEAITAEGEAQELSMENQEELIAMQEAEAEAIRLKAEALQAARAEYGNYALAALDAGAAEINWTDELFRSATQMGISQEQTILLAAATGEYSDEQIEAMLKTAAMRVAVEELAAQMASGSITTQDALAAMQDFEAQLDKDYTAQFDYSDLEDATGAASGLRESLLAAEGDYSASFTTTNTTINRVVEERYTKDNGSQKSSDAPTAYYSGGDFRANEFLVVGDGPNGQILPTTELVAFDRPGTVINGRDTNAIFDRLSAQLDNNNLAPQTGSKIEMNLHFYTDPTREVVEQASDEMLTALREAGF